MPLETLLFIIIATMILGFIGLTGALTLVIKKKYMERILIILVAFSAGTLLSGALFHMLSEALDMMGTTITFTYLLIGFIMFFLIERFLHWHHCHDGLCDVHPFSQLILVGDSIHNFIDGLIVAASFLVNLPFGILTTLIIIGHEIPQELGNFAVLVYGGYSNRKSLLYNFLVQLTAVIGGIAGFFLLYSPENVAFLLPFAAGGFIYIASSDLIPELHKEKKLSKSMISFAFFLIGILFLIWMKLAFGA